MSREKEQFNQEYIPRFASELMNQAFARLDYGVLDLETENEKLREENETLQGNITELYSRINSKNDSDMKNVLKTIIGVPLDSDSVGMVGATIMARARDTLDQIKKLKTLGAIHEYIDSVIPDFTYTIVETPDEVN